MNTDELRPYDYIATTHELTGKVTGTVTVTYLGWCVRIGTTEVRRGQEDGTLSFRGKDYRGDVSAKVENGKAELTGTYRGSFRTGVFSDATAHAQAQIEAALLAFLPTVYDAKLDALGRVQEAMRNEQTKRRDAEEARAKYEEELAEHTEAVQALTKARKAYDAM